MNQHSLVKKVMGHALLIIACASILIPIYWMIVSAFEPNSDILSTTPHFFPSHFAPGNLLTALKAQPFGRFFLNSCIMSALIVFCQVVTSSLAAYALVFIPMHRSKGWFFLILLAMMIPMQATFIPVYLILSKVHLINTYMGLVLPFAGSAFGIFLLRQGFVSVPKAIVHAARIDGASEWRILGTIVLPNAKPIIITLVLLNFVFHYNDLFWPLISTNAANMRVVPVALSYFLSQEPGQTLQWNLLMAADLVTILPALALFLLGQRYIVRGIMSSAVKG
ncbi:carbohydrate ABC transporter permease [Pullulanibacillus sp. KACC 23026]|uniref:carbohydrate ABC transporter permease n=1 Tax=Pullulanibacillus sp. KACC 23026 TaxID=3028315 RepID=UPI0023AF1C9C|nr:carbohydrate ABC transporter permease [Pullulanibacillus sp. KACC 23026]WEG13509.1 carbohydrate ABC transporter permease [Pullulanibacillus sp. KACC 23026]